MSNTFDLSKKKTDLTAIGGLQLNASNISCVNGRSWFMQESSGQRPDSPTGSDEFYWKLFSQNFFQKWVREILVGSF